MKLLILYVLLSASALSKSPDAFAGTWRLNVKKSIFKVKDDTYKAGERTYTLTPDGERVQWTLVDSDGKEVTGEYAVHCVHSECRSDAVRWKQTAPRTVHGELVENGVVTRRYLRTVTPDGRSLTIKFYKSDATTLTSVQVWERR